MIKEPDACKSTWNVTGSKYYMRTTDTSNIVITKVPGIVHDRDMGDEFIA